MLSLGKGSLPRPGGTVWEHWGPLRAVKGPIKECGGLIGHIGVSRLLRAGLFGNIGIKVDPAVPQYVPPNSESCLKALVKNIC